MKNRIFIGTSGWDYFHWQEKFYPPNLSSEEKLKYFSQHFKTVEVNSSFYHSPKATTYQKWYQNTPPDFLFAIKVNRTITHLKKLKGIKRIWGQFLKKALLLKEKLGPFLFQFPPSFSANYENLKRVREFIKILEKNRQQYKNLKFAFEFRHPSWFQRKIYQLFKKHHLALVIADSPSWPKTETVTANFVYLRFHGSKVLFASSCSQKELKIYALKIRGWLKKKLEIFAYFNNDAWGYALENARDLLKILTNNLQKIK